MIYALGKLILGFYLKVFNKFVVKNKENIVNNGPLIVFANHYSALDIFAIQVLYKNHISFMAKKELFNTPVVKWFIRAYRAISVDRAGNDIAAIKSAMKVLKENNILGIFPEGTRVRDGIRHDAKSGLAMLAHKLKVPMQPIKISYKRKFNLFNRIEITVGTPIYPNELGIATPCGEEYEKATNKLMDIVYSM